MAAAGAFFVLGIAPAAAASAADNEGQPATATTVDVGTTKVVATSIETKTTRDVEQVDRDKGDTDDDSNVGLWGLLGLLGLLGLAGLAGLRRNRDGTGGSGVGRTISGDTTPRGSSTSDR